VIEIIIISISVALSIAACILFSTGPFSLKRHVVYSEQTENSLSSVTKTVQQSHRATVKIDSSHNAPDNFDS